LQALTANLMPLEVPLSPVVTSARPALVAAAILLLLGTLSAAAATPHDAAPRILMQRESGPPQHFLGEAQSGPPPTGPALPTIQDGIGPGSAMHQGPTPGTTAYICTAAFLLRDPATATYYLSTAGHCLVRDESDPTPYTGAANPDKVNQEIDICVAGCIDNALGLGTYVRLTAKDGYQPVAYGESGGPGQDFGIIEIPADKHDLLRPWMPQFGGPTGAAATRSGDALVHYGHGSYCCPSAGGVGGSVATRTPADQGRVATSLGANSLFGGGKGSFSAVGSSTGGDSGSGVAIGNPSATRGMQGGAAVGVLTHGVAVEGIPYFEGTTLEYGLGMVRAATGLELQLVLQDDPLNAVGDPTAHLAHIAIEDPVPGATVSPGGDGTTAIQGSAGKGNQTPPPDALVQVAIDDASFGTANRVPVAGNASWSAQWDLHGVPLGLHTIYARLVLPDGRALAAVNQTVTVAERGATPSPTPGSSPPPPGATGTQRPGASGGSAAPGATGSKATGSSTSHKTPLPALVPLLAVAGAALALRRKR
jgi:hypothetical protein